MGIEMDTSHVGSYPLDHSLSNLRRAFLDTLDAGISVPPVPQLRPFTDMYLEPLAEMGYLEPIGGGKYRPIDLRGEPRIRIEEVEWFLEVAKEAGFNLSKVRLPITGPFTLASRVEIGEGGIFNSLLADKRMLFDFFVPYVANISREMDSKGFGYIFVDEPVIGLLVGKRILFSYTEEDIVESYEVIFSDVTARRGTHICGKLSPRLTSLLMNLPLTYLSHEFYDSRSNLERFSREGLEEGDKIISPGVVSAQNLRVEGREEVILLLGDIIEKFGEERVDLVSGDCGFGGLKAAGPKAYESAIGKLKVIAEVVRSFQEDPK